MLLIEKAKTPHAINMVNVQTTLSILFYGIISLNNQILTSVSYSRHSHDCPIKGHIIPRWAITIRIIIEFNPSHCVIFRIKSYTMPKTCTNVSN